MMGRRRDWANAWVFGALALLLTGGAAAPQPAARPDTIRFGLPVLSPFAYVHFCVRYPDECRVRGRAFRRPQAPTLTAKRRAEIVSVNMATNRAIDPVRHLDDTSFDTWRIGPKTGDCNDYAVTKRHELLARGWPTRALLLAEVETVTNEHHLVLLVRTAAGDVVLDNLTPQIRRWSDAGYHWVRVQSPDEPALWSTIVAPVHKSIS